MILLFIYNWLDWILDWIFAQKNPSPPNGFEIQIQAHK